MTRSIDRRGALKLMGGTAAVGALYPMTVRGDWGEPRVSQLARSGVVVGQPEAALIGQRIIAEGGNAMDGMVAAALACGVTQLAATGIGGYGGHMTIAMKGRPVRSIDCNSTAPGAIRHDTFKAAADGTVPGRVNETGWLSAGVPGTLAGMQLALDTYGTKPLGDVMAPAIELAEEGFELPERLAQSIARSQAMFRADPGSRALFFADGEPPAAGSTFRNPDLARMLRSLANANSVEAFYRGDIGRHVASEFQKHGGLVTAEDMAAYQAREVQPLTLDWLGQTVHTAPLTAGGATVMEALSILRALDSTGGQLGSAHARVEALRIAWDDRLRFLGDPEHAGVPLHRLLSSAYAGAMAERVAQAVEDAKPLAITTPERVQEGTIHLSAADSDGNIAAVTFTHGGGFGARVTVEGLGLILGHGVSRFDPRSSHPNSPGPGKRPLHNMCPTIVTRDGAAWLAVGGRGGRQIPNGTFDVLVGILQGKTMPDAMEAPRMHTTGNLDLQLASTWDESEVAAFTRMGYEVRRGAGARMSAAAIDPETGTLLGMGPK